MLKQLIRLVRLDYSESETREEAKELRTQTGALPCRMGRDKRLEVLLVTGRRSHRWTIPKGWPMAGKTLAQAAAQEAFEEAGIKGKVDSEPLGSFNHIKQTFSSGTLEVNIVVHPMWVERQLAKWPECGQRERKWFSIEEAADKVDSAELRALIMKAAERDLAGFPKRAKA